MWNSIWVHERKMVQSRWIAGVILAGGMLIAYINENMLTVDAGFRDLLGMFILGQVIYHFFGVYFWMVIMFSAKQRLIRDEGEFTEQISIDYEANRLSRHHIERWYKRVSIAVFVLPFIAIVLLSL